jgi:arylsulfatase A-like enzyme
MLYGGFDHLSEEQVPISVPLSEDGYATAGFHSNPYLSGQFGYARGFDTYSDQEEDPDFTSRIRRYVANNVSGPVHDILSWIHDKAEKHGGIDVGAYYQNATDITNQVLQWTESVEDPWFVWAHYMDPHHPYVPPEEHQLFGETQSQRRGVKLRQQVLEDPDTLSERDWSDLINLYDAEIRYTDSEIGRLIENLSNAIWAITADHGEEFYEHGNFGHKNRFYEEHVHVPLLFGGDDTGTGRHDHLVGLNDVPETLLQAVDIPSPDTYRGQNLFAKDRKEVLGGWGPETGSDPDRVRLMHRTADRKFITDTMDATEQLYNLSTDPEERDNIVSEVDISRQRAAVEAFETEIRETAQSTEAVEISDDLQEQLRNLGYKE